MHKYRSLFSTESGLASRLLTTPYRRAVLCGPGIGLGAAMLLVVAFSIHAQEGVRWKRYSLDEGLSQASIYSIHQGSQGFMWFGTQDGLNRFDGRHFEVFRHSTKNPNSISDNQINSISEDRQGNLWVGTDHGLNKWVRDEHRFELFTHPDHPTLSSAQVTWTYCSRNNEIWFSHDDGFACYNPATKSYFHYDAEDYDIPALNSWNFEQFSEDSEGRIWVHTTDSGAVVFIDHEPLAVNVGSKEFPGLPSNSIWDLEIGPDGQPWMATSGGVAHWDTKTSRFQVIAKEGRFHIPYLDLNSIAFDRLGRMWVSMHIRGLCRVDLSSGRVELFNQENGKLPTDTVGEVVVARDGQVWVQTMDWDENTLLRFNGRGFDACRNNPIDPFSICPNSRIVLQPGTDGELWVGSDGGGLSFYNPRLENFALITRLYESPEALSDRKVRSLYQDSKRRLWIGCYEGLNMRKPGEAVIHKYKHGFREPKTLPHNWVNEMFEDRTGRLWLGGQEGVCYYNEETDDFTRMELPSIPSDSSLYVNTFWQDEGGGLMVCYGLNKMAKLDTSTQSWNLVTPFDFLGESNVSEILRLKNGDLCITTFGQGFFMVSSNGAYQHQEYKYRDPSSVSHAYVNDVVESSDGVIWLATENGFNRFDPVSGEFRHYMIEDGLPNQVIYNLHMDGNGRIWMSTNAGLSCFDPASEKFTNYDVSDGLQSKEFNGGASFRAKDGTMYFGGINGFNYFHPDRLRVTSPPPVLNLMGITVHGGGSGHDADKAFGAGISGTPTLTLEPDESSFTIFFIGIDYLNPEGVTYRYRLHGSDEEWISLGNQDHLDFNHLAHGDYVVEIQALNGDGVASALRQVKVTVLPRFYEAGWFKGMVIFLVFLFTSLFFFNRNRKIRRQRSKLEAQVKERTQEVVTQMEEVRIQKELVEQKNQEVLDSIKYAKRLQEAILPASKLVKAHLSDSFILYKPKDIVAGDFYWMEHHEDEVWYAAADCTGHGVPGAMVSVVCANALNRAFNEFGLRQPGEILDKVRELVVETYARSDEEVRDGMDVALVRQNLKTHVVEYAGANNPLWVVRQGEEFIPSQQDEEVAVAMRTITIAGVSLAEVKADKQPVGVYENATAFTNHVLQLQEGDVIYAFTDGFADQFGGVDAGQEIDSMAGKKFKYKPFKKFLCSIHHESMEEQMQMLDRVFEDWKGGLEQVDDVCVIGVRV